MKCRGLEEVPTTELRKLVNDLTSGSLAHGISEVGVEKIWKGAFPAASELILGLGKQGWHSGQLGFMLDQVIEARSEESRFSHWLDLVISGPDVPGVTMRATGSVFQEMVSRAEEEVLLASFAIYNGQSIFAPLVKRWEERPNLSVKLFLDIPRPRNDTTIESALVARYRKRFVEKEWPGQNLPELYHFLPALESNTEKRASMHAKVVVVDRSEVFISSANFTNAAQTKNIEVGVKVCHPASAIRIHEYFLKMVTEGEFRSF
ncbi:MAG: DISARM system phospholipase D-like protein DrmC [Verrucomicrobiales bacterium]|nr:DISARM system phospholipase D-like protein DrmC [Verrucomicrobiales bacterium]